MFVLAFALLLDFRAASAHDALACHSVRLSVRTYNAGRESILVIPMPNHDGAVGSRCVWSSQPLLLSVC